MGLEITPLSDKNLIAKLCVAVALTALKTSKCKCGPLV
jgi:hypothetical protein